MTCRHSTSAHVDDRSLDKLSVFPSHVVTQSHTRRRDRGHPCNGVPISTTVLGAVREFVALYSTWPPPTAASNWVRTAQCCTWRGGVAYGLDGGFCCSIITVTLKHKRSHARGAQRPSIQILRPRSTGFRAHSAYFMGGTVMASVIDRGATCTAHTLRPFTTNTAQPRA